MSSIAPKAVLISDIHYNLKNLSLAENALNQAARYAEQLKIPLIIAGDLHDSKAILRGECVNAMIKTFKSIKTTVYIIPGNHCRINEKAPEHSLEFLKPYGNIIDTPTLLTELNLFLIPYQSTNDDFKAALDKSPKNVVIIAHQGLKGAAMGEYIKDDSSIDPSILSGVRVISGHYHQKQDIKTPAGLWWSYLGSPYTITAAEANDGPKGFSVLYKDGSLELIPTNLRKHVKIETHVSNVLKEIPNLNTDDLLWLKVIGTYLELEALSKKDIGLHHLGHCNFKLEKVYTDKIINNTQDIENLTDSQLFDSIIDTTQETIENKEDLKRLWRDLVNENT